MADKGMFSETVVSFLGPIKDYLTDDSINEIMINGPDEIFIEQRGRLVRTDRRFTSLDGLMAAIRNVSQFVGRRIDERNPYLDARLPDGSRFHAMLPPIARRGPYVSIRRFSSHQLTLVDLVANKTMNQQTADFLMKSVESRKNILVAGGTGSGKTTMLNILSAFIPEDERIIVIEDASELQLVQSHVLPMETRPGDAEGKGAVTIRDLLACSLRLRPDRIIIGECRGGEALDMLQAMNVGHSGSMTTLHANSAKDALSRLETMTLMSGVELPLNAIRSQIASAVDLVVHISRNSDGSRCIKELAELKGLDEQAKFIIRVI